jgi:hypothetical protein
MADVGRPTDLTEDLTLEIRKHVLDGTSYGEIQRLLSITDSAWDRWVWLDYKDFRSKLNEWKKERMIKKAEKNLEEMLDMPVNVLDDDVVVTEPALVKIKQDTSKFVVERLNKDEYSSRQENTGKDGKDLLPTPILAPLNVPTDNGDNQNKQAEESNPGDTGGNVSQQDHLDSPITDPRSPERHDPNVDLDSQRVIPSLEAGGDAGLPGDNGAAPILQGQQLE